MAHDDRTEKATPKHRERARKKGQVARSADVGGSLVLAAGLFGLSLLGPRIVSSTSDAFEQILRQIAHPNSVTSATGLRGLMSTTLSALELGIAPIAGVCLAAGMLSGAAQVTVEAA